jgi:hypothetical protein
MHHSAQLFPAFQKTAHRPAESILFRFPAVEKLLPGQRYLLDVQAGWAEVAAKARHERQRKRTFSLPFSRHGSASSSVSSESNRGSQSSRGSAHSTERASSVGSPRGSSSASSVPGDDQEKQPVLMFKRKIFLGADLDPPGTSDGDPVHMEARAFEYTQVKQRSSRQDEFSLGCLRASYLTPAMKSKACSAAFSAAGKIALIVGKSRDACFAVAAAS